MEEVPFEDRHVPRAEIEWERSLWWWRPLTRAIHPAIKLTTLVLGVVAIWTAKIGIQSGTWLFKPETAGGEAWQFPGLYSQQASPSGIFSSPILVWFSNAFSAILQLKFGIQELAFVSFAALWLTMVFSLLGGVLSRRAMVELGQQTIAPWGESFKIVFRRWLSYLWATGMHLVGLLVVLLPFALLGLIARTSGIGAHIGGVLLILCFPLVFAVGRLLMSMIFCYPLSVCAIAAEKKADAFEGFSRSNAYLFQRPVVAAICVLVLAAVGLVGEQLVWWSVSFGWGAIRSVYFFFGGAVQEASNQYIKVGNGLSGELLSAYWFSFFWAASGAVYLILRRSVDNTELHELDSIESSVESSLPPIPTTPPSGEEKTEAPNDAGADSTEKESSGEAS